MLAKGPVALLIPLAVTFLFCWLRRDLKLWLRTVFDLRALALFAVIALPWYAIILHKEGAGFVQGFFIKHNVSRFSGPLQGHAGSLVYYIPVVLIGTLPFTALARERVYAAQDNMARRSAVLPAALVRVRVRVLLAVGDQAAALRACTA